MQVFAVPEGVPTTDPEDEVDDSETLYLLR